MQNGVSWYFRDDDETYKTFYRYIQASAYVWELAQLFEMCTKYTYTFMFRPLSYNFYETN